MKKPNRFNRYTTIPVLLDMLSRKRLVLLDPSTWEDKNDSEVLAEYKRRRKLGALFALCGSQGDETIHHWKAFADGISGCCVEFELDELVQLLKSFRGVRLGPIRYRKLKDLCDGSIRVAQMPFTKRWPYRCENEYRVIWESRTPAAGFEIPFDLQMIRRVTISQRMPAQIYATIRDTLKGAVNNPAQRINRSTIYQNDVWIAKFTKA
jgi:hypothetical protein